MIKKITLMSIIVSTVMFSGCGGSSNSSDTPVANKYEKLTDLEYKTLNITNTFRNNKTLDQTIKFHDDYDQDGKYLFDYRSTKDATILCGEVENNDVFKYFCLYGSSTDNSMISYALSIDTDGKITGNSKYSETGNTTELTEVYDGNKASASITGTVSVTETSNKQLIQIDKSSFKDFKSTKTNVNSIHELKASTEINTMLEDMKSIIKK